MTDFFNLSFWAIAKSSSDRWTSYSICMTIQKERPEMFYKKSVLKNFTKFSRKHLCQSLRTATFLKKRLWHSFPVNFVKFLRTSFLQNTCRRLLLKIVTLLLVAGSPNAIFSLSSWEWNATCFRLRIPAIPSNALIVAQANFLAGRLEYWFFGVQENC